MAIMRIIALESGGYLGIHGTLSMIVTLIVVLPMLLGRFNDSGRKCAATVPVSMRLMVASMGVEPSFGIYRRKKQGQGSNVWHYANSQGPVQHFLSGANNSFSYRNEIALG